jgi:hypothetical protein
MTTVNGTESHPGDVTLGEVMRLIERNHAETRDDFQAVFIRMDREQASVDGRLNKTVSLDVYVSDKRADEERFKRLENDIVSARATTRWAIGVGASSVLTMVAISVPVLLNTVGK